MARSAKLPMSVDLRGHVGPIQDQGDRPTCLAFAATVAHELHRLTNVAVNEDLSEEALYWGSRRLDAAGRSGISFAAARDALDKWGQPIEAVWPYNPSLDESKPYHPPSSVRPGGRGWHRARLRKTRCTVDSLRKELVSGNIVVLGVLLTSGFYRPVGNWIPSPIGASPRFAGTRSL
jgi:hypothetical protein